MPTPSIILSHSLQWKHTVLLTVGDYSINHRVLYTIGISMTMRFQKSEGPSVRPSVCLSVCPFATLTKNPTPPSLLIVER